MIGPLLKHRCFLTILLFLFYCATEGDVKHGKENDAKVTSLQLPPCEACTMVYESFMDAMKLTAQNHFGGGDTSWEEAKLGPYATSEVRLIEIQELLCSNKRAQNQCLILVEEWEQYLEDWWFKQKKDTPDLHEYLCMNSLKICCPSGHFGPECQPCPGFPHNICNNNGKCKGNGTRGGNGDCYCEKGYGGKLCEKCDGKYFEVHQDNKLRCEKCHSSCEGGCTSSGPESCYNCAKGWTLEIGKGCVDIDECTVYPVSSLCKEQEFCMNTPGSFKCSKCDQACDGCSGPGPDQCVKCSSGYTLVGSACVIKDTSKSYDISKSYSDITHYLVTLSLCVAMFILLKNRPLWAIGGALSLITAEYMLGSTFMNEVTSSILKYIKIW